MKTLRWLLLAPIALAGLLVLVINFSAAPMDEAPAPSRSMVIPMPDGTDRTLGELVDASRGEGGPAAPTQPTRAEETEAERAPMAPLLEGPGAPASGATDLIALAEFQLHAGRPDEAMALFRSVPEDHPQYSFALRRIGWDCYTRGMGEPGRGVAFVNASLRSDPWSGNAWQDASRVYMHRLGLRVR